MTVVMATISSSVQTIPSKVFGDISVDASTIYTFPLGLPGLEQAKKFTLVTFKEYHPIVWMISIDGIYHFPMAPFASLDPEDLDEESETVYLPQLTSILKKRPETVAYIIIRLDPDVTKISLKAPVVVNPSGLEAKQYILDQHQQKSP